MSRHGEADERWEKRLRAIGMAVELVTRCTEPGGNRTFVLTEVRAQLDADHGTGVLLIVKGEGDTGKIVGFVGGADLGTALLTLKKKLAVGAVRWREDRPWGAGAS